MTSFPERESVQKWQADEGVSFLALGATVLRNRWRIARWMLIGGTVAALWVFTKPALYRASASFISQGTDPARSGLASLAGQFGVSMPTGSQWLSIDFYAKLLKSPKLLERVARDTLVVPEMGQQRVTVLDLFGINGGAAGVREERAVKRLSAKVKTSVGKTSGIVEVAVETEWPSVSLAIVRSLVDGVTEFNLRTRQGQAAAERRFVEGRLALAGTELRAAEDRLEAFLRTNRQFGDSPELTFQRDRLQRAVTLQQQVYTSLMQNYEEVRIREVRDTPVITMFEEPSVGALPEPRGRVSGILLGLVLGAGMGAAIALASGIAARRPAPGVDDMAELASTFAEVKDELLKPVRWIGGRVRRHGRSE